MVEVTAESMIQEFPPYFCIVYLTRWDWDWSLMAEWFKAAGIQELRELDEWITS